jgi:hypothetical protein
MCGGGVIACARGASTNVAVPMNIGKVAAALLWQLRLALSSGAAPHRAVRLALALMDAEPRPPRSIGRPLAGEATHWRGGHSPVTSAEAHWPQPHAGSCSGRPFFCFYAQGLRYQSARRPPCTGRGCWPSGPCFRCAGFAGARLTLLGKKSAEAAQLDTFAALQSVCDPAIELRQ